MRVFRVKHPSAPKKLENNLLGTDHFSGPMKFEGVRKLTIETGRNRLLVTGLVFALSFLLIGVRLVELSLGGKTNKPPTIKMADTKTTLDVRADIRDRNGTLLATSLPISHLYANPRLINNPEWVVHELKRVFPNLNRNNLLKKLLSNGTFVWVKKGLNPNQQFEVNALGIPGLDFLKAEKRHYPHGRLASHILGITDTDGIGQTGIERYFDRQLRNQRKPITLSIDARIQAIMRSELLTAIQEFVAIGAAGIALDVNSGEIIAMVSLPDFDPNKRNIDLGVPRFNRATHGIYEMGSTFKLFTAATGLDTGRVRLRDRYDARSPIKISRFTISDYHAKNKWLSVPEIVVHSSNIGAAKMALAVGVSSQKSYLRKFGLLSPVNIELFEVGTPKIPRVWREVRRMTIGFGHGIAVSPLQLAIGVGALVNGGVLYNPTLLNPESKLKVTGKRVISLQTSKQIRNLMRLVVRQGTGKKADIPGYFLGGKTGTADKPGNKKKGYGGRGKISSFVSAFPISAPRYLIFVLIDEPKGNDRTQGWATGGWVAAPVVGSIVRQMVSIFGMEPSDEIEHEIKPTNVLYISQDKPKFVSIDHTSELKTAIKAEIDNHQYFKNASRGQALETN